MTISSILSICLLITVTAISACTPWHVKYGIPEGADMKAPENTAKLIEVMRSPQIKGIFYQVIVSCYSFGIVMIIGQPKSRFFRSAIQSNIYIVAHAGLKCL